MHASYFIYPLLSLSLSLSLSLFIYVIFSPVELCNLVFLVTFLFSRFDQHPSQANKILKSQSLSLVYLSHSLSLHICIECPRFYGPRRHLEFFKNPSIQVIYSLRLIGYMTKTILNLGFSCVQRVNKGKKPNYQLACNYCQSCRLDYDMIHAVILS